MALAQAPGLCNGQKICGAQVQATMSWFDL